MWIQVFDASPLARAMPAPLAAQPPTGSAQRLHLRPVQVQDDVLLAELLAGLSPQARQRRFHGAFKLSFAHVQQMCRVEPQRQQALVVTSTWQGAEQIVADARYCVHAGGQSAEFALLVHEQWQRRGVGQWAMQRLEHVARRAGLRFLIGPVQADNLPMLALMAHCGYALAPDPDEDGLVQARLDLNPLGVAGQLAQWMQTSSRRVRPLHAVH